jgi:hypothetical protein
VDRDIFRDVAEKSRIYMREIWAAREDRSREQARAAGRNNEKFQCPQS